MGGWLGGWLGGCKGGSYSDIKTNLSQVGLNWDWPTGLSLAKYKHTLCPRYLLASFPTGISLGKNSDFIISI